MQAWHLWAVAALLLALAELAGGQFILLGLGLAAAVVAVVLIFLPGMGFAGQLLIFGVAAAVIVPLIVMVFRRYFPEQGVSVMNEPGGKAGEPRPVVERDGRIGVEIYGDFYPAEFPSGIEPEKGMEVVVLRFRGIKALVRAVDGGSSRQI
ncbi:membrane protein implicated in regulation of membrane protease activity [Natronospira proteinivora]|uniref:Membrane protein implicated in regulation of membrane protease activity n=1 Tax=Natronospira proteinivora TaxID=1807133 RepID=A0ABT1G4S2_9GAMM|nr:hypothetical protein [Natronospira proteinivora]MCP1726290.1 membrane protein implicated in regulation of membrane protease activity [Natronospira proteinivora]